MRVRLSLQIAGVERGCRSHRRWPWPAAASGGGQVEFAAAHIHSPRLPIPKANKPIIRGRPALQPL